jgi:hypothetical protein
MRQIIGAETVDMVIARTARASASSAWYRAEIAASDDMAMTNFPLLQLYWCGALVQRLVRARIERESRSHQRAPWQKVGDRAEQCLLVATPSVQR